jgi:hypothetical protein
LAALPAALLASDFYQLSVAGEKVYATAADRAAAAAKRRTRAPKATSSASTASSTSASQTWTLTELENEGELVWQSLNASVTLEESKRAECEDLKHVLHAFRTGSFDSRAKALIREATQACISQCPAIVMCDQNDSVNQINYMSAHIFSITGAQFTGFRRYMTTVLEGTKAFKSRHHQA